MNHTILQASSSILQDINKIDEYSERYNERREKIKIEKREYSFFLSQKGIKLKEKRMLKDANLRMKWNDRRRGLWCDRRRNGVHRQWSEGGSCHRSYRGS